MGPDPNSGVRISVHSRGCGEQKVIGGGGVTVNDSSPRVRGTVERHLRFGLIDRFIHARAGNRPWSFQILPAASVHSRACGNRTHRASSRWSATVHPRACGEQAISLERNIASPGSSPRVRGTGQAPRHAVHALRFIPARAGNRGHINVIISDRRVHPRACGEQTYSRANGAPADGSSPHVRGTEFAQALGFQALRFIPARAGNSAGTATGALPTAVHPRACGEQDDLPRGLDLVAGSSPRVRGTEVTPHQHGAAVRFIPARAGNSCDNRFCRGVGSVHPRACGEQGPTTTAPS